MHRQHVLISLAAVVVVASSCTEPQSTAARQEEVAKKGAKVMPFDLDRTTHVFKPLPDGGLQVVVADDPNDREQVALIRQHLRKEARAFSQGDFGDPATIHGDEMPGLEELSRSYDQISVALAETPDGAQLRYRTEAPEVVDALHRWFEAQLMDHGAHAREGH